MSHPNPQHDPSNEYPADKITHYPHRKAGKSGGPLHNIANRLTAKAKALQKRMKETGGRFTK